MSADDEVGVEEAEVLLIRVWRSHGELVARLLRSGARDRWGQENVGVATDRAEVLRMVGRWLEEVSQE